jgi:hypothetical protein
MDHECLARRLQMQPAPKEGIMKLLRVALGIGSFVFGFLGFLAQRSLVDAVKGMVASTDAVSEVDEASATLATQEEGTYGHG